MRIRNHLVLATLAGVLLLGGSASADIRGDLAALKTAAEGLLAGGELNAGQRKAVGKLIAGVEKAEAVEAGDDVKLLKKLSGVVKQIEKAAKKGADLGAHVPGLLAGAAAKVDDLRSQAEQLTEMLQVEKDAGKARAKIDKAAAKRDQAAEAFPESKQAKLYAKAAKLFAKAAATALKLFEREIDRGLVQLRILSTSLDEMPKLPNGEPLVPSGIPLLLNLNLAVDPVVLPGGVAQVLVRPGAEPRPGEVRIEAQTDENGKPFLVLNFDPPLDPGTYTLRVLGEDGGGVFLVTPQGVGLKETFETDFTVE